MNGQPQQTAQCSGTQQQLQHAEIEFCRLNAEKEALEIRLSETDSGDIARRNQIREELRAIKERVAAVQVEQMEHRIALLSEQLPRDREAIMPLQTAFDKSDIEYRKAYNDRETAALALHNAQMKVSNAESNISFYESSMEKLRQQLTTSSGNRARLASEITSEITGLESRLRQLRIMAPQPITETGLIR